MRAEGLNPSYLPLDLSSERDGLLRPVDTISWEDARTLLGRLALALPSEAQWEFAARAGTTSLWCSGDARETLAGVANAPWEDPLTNPGNAAHATVPVMQLGANAFGLHNVHGNVAEWVLDAYVPSYAAASPRGDPPNEPANERPLRITRGGGAASDAGELRSSARSETPAGTRSATIGVRPARAIEREPALGAERGEHGEMSVERSETSAATHAPNNESGSGSNRDRAHNDSRELEPAHVPR